MTHTEAITIRHAGPGDAALIRGMVDALARATGRPDGVHSRTEDFLRHGFGPAPLFRALIAEVDGRPAGLCLFFYTFSTWLGEPGVYVQDLYVDEAARGSGVGRRLMRAVAREGRNRQATHLRLSVDRQNHDAQRFYERLGMHYREHEHTYHVGEDAFERLAEDRA